MLPIHEAEVVTGAWVPAFSHIDEVNFVTLGILSLMADKSTFLSWRFGFTALR
jgi:hypothetical protein